MKKLIYSFMAFTIILFGMYGCGVCTNGKKNNTRYKLIYRTQGCTNKMFFYNERNPYIATIKQIKNEFCLIVKDAISNKEYVLKSDEPIVIKGGDITYK